PTATPGLRAGGARRAGGADRGDVTVIGAAASAEDDQLRMEPAQLGVASGKLGGITAVELLGLVELGVAERGSVGPDAANPAGPRRARFEHGLEVGRMGA